VAGARVTWLVLAACALLVGHSFVLAIDLFSAASRSALGFELMLQQMDPLAGIVRPMLGGLEVGASLLVPVLATRGLAIERERQSYGALSLAAGGTTRVVLAKGAAAAIASLAMALPVLILLVLFLILDGHVDMPETSIALLGHVLHLLALTAIALAAAAGTRTVAQATTVAVAISLAWWAIDAGEGFAALAWLGQLDWLSMSRRLMPFEQGIVSIGAIGWLLALTCAALAIAVALGRIARARVRWAPAASLAALCAVTLFALGHVRRAYDWSEQRRASLPPAIALALRRVDRPIRLDVFFDRDDGRRAQFERDALAKLRLARPDLVVDAPLDRRERPREGVRSTGYGRIVLHVGAKRRDTRSTSRRELSSLILETAGRAVPRWSQPIYAGYPTIIEGAARTAVAIVAYAIVPGLFLALGWIATRSRRRTS